MMEVKINVKLIINNTGNLVLMIKVRDAKSFMLSATLVLNIVSLKELFS